MFEITEIELIAEHLLNERREMSLKMSRNERLNERTNVKKKSQQQQQRQPNFVC